jgi:short-subunit dehydrogenase
VVLAHELARPMAARGRGGVVLIASLAGSTGSPVIATYAATKSFNLVPAEGLWEELSVYGVHVVACRPSAVRSPPTSAPPPSAIRP